MVRLKESLQASQDASLSKATVDPNLEQGDDLFDVEYRMEQFGRPVSETGTASFSWNEIFGTLGPLMFDEASEPTLERSIGRSVEEREGIDPDDYVGGSKVTLLPDCFQQIEVQLLALGDVERSQRQRSVKDTATYWSLTNLGEDTLMALRALRREKKSD